MNLRARLIRRLGVTQCGAFGGILMPTFPGGDKHQRWCRKPFGHSDSCAYDVLPDQPISQPGAVLRSKFRGWS